MANLANKYRPKDFSSIVEQSLVIDMIRKFCESPELDTRNFLLIGPAGTGKAQPLYSKVLTPNGYIEMRDVHKGTEVFTHTGAVAKVSAIFPQGELDVYQINLADGGSIRVADNHLNIFNIEESGVSKRYTMSTTQLIKRFGGKTRSETFTVDNLVYDETNHCVVQLAEKRIMQSIHYVGKEECQCIFVSHKDHTYISDCCIPTHNTTTARIMANVLNEGKGGYIELDAASNGSADSIRELIQQARQYPVGMNYRILIVDECQCLSYQSWANLLKTLEESPAKTVFIFLTTNPEKIPATILSRVQTFQLSKISVEGITNRLKQIIDCENKEGRNITYTEDSVSYIAKLSGGGLRDALTLLDKSLAYSESITSENLMIALNLPAYDDYFALLGAYSKHDNESIAKIIDKVYNSGVNFVKWFEGFHSFVINITKFIFIQDINATMIPAHYADKLTKYNVKHANVCLKLASKLLKLVADLKTTSYLQEVALTYLCSPQQVKENTNG